MKKRLLIALLIAAFLIPFSALATGPELSEQEEPIIVARYQDMDSARAKLTVSGKTASYSLKVVGSNAVTKIVATLQIQKQNTNGTYSDFGLSWDATANSSVLTTNGTKTVSSDGIYRLKATVKLYTSSTAYSVETVYS